MLQIFRDNKQSGFIYIIFAAIILAFVLMFGLPSTDIFSGVGNKTIATIGKHKIDQEFMRSMRLRHFSDKAMNAEELRSVQLQIVDALSVIYVLADEARAAGLRVSEDELNDYITNWESGNPDIHELGFLRNNKFAKASFELALARNQISAKRYKEYKTNELLAKRYMTLMASSISVSDATLWQKYAQNNEAANIEVIKISPAAVAKTFPKLTDEEITGALTTDAEQIKNYYEEHIADYTTDAKAKLQQILIQKDFSKLGNVGSKTVKTHQPAERFAIVRHQVIEEGTDFVQAFTDYDEAETKLENGTGPLLSINDMAEGLQTELEGKAVGDILSVELEDRYIIAKVVERSEKIVTPLDDVKRDIAKKLLQDKRVDARMQALKAPILAKANEGMSFNEILEKTLYKDIALEEAPEEVLVQEAPIAAKEDEAIVDVDALIEKIIADALANSDMGDGSSVDEIIDRALADAEDEIAAAVAKAAQQSETSAAVAEVKNSSPTLVQDNRPAKLVIPIDERIQALELESNLSSGFINGLGVNDDIVRDILAAKAGDFLNKDYQIGKDIIFVKVIERKPATRDSFEFQKEDLRERELDARIASLVGIPASLDRMYATYGIWVNRKVQEAKADGRIKINQSYFDSFATRSEQN